MPHIHPGQKPSTLCCHRHPCVPQALSTHLHWGELLGPLPCTTLSEWATTSPRLMGTRAARSPAEQGKWQYTNGGRQRHLV